MTKVTKSIEVKTVKQLAVIGKSAKGIVTLMQKSARNNQFDLIDGYSSLGQLLDNTLLKGEKFDSFCLKYLNVGKASGYYYQHINANKEITIKFLKTNSNVIANSINELEQLGVKLNRAIDANTTLPSTKGMTTVKEFNSALQAVLSPKGNDKAVKNTDALKNIKTPAKLDNIAGIIEQLEIGFDALSDADKAKAVKLYIAMTIKMAEVVDKLDIKDNPIKKVSRKKAEAVAK